MELEAEFDIRVRVSCKTIEEYNTLNKALTEAIDNIVHVATGWKPISMHVEGMLPYPKVRYALGKGRIR